MSRPKKSSPSKAQREKAMAERRLFELRKERAQARIEVIRLQTRALLRRAGEPLD